MYDQSQFKGTIYTNRGRRGKQMRKLSHIQLTAFSEAMRKLLNLIHPIRTAFKVASCYNAKQYHSLTSRFGASYWQWPGL